MGVDDKGLDTVCDNVELHTTPVVCVGVVFAIDCVRDVPEGNRGIFIVVNKDWALASIDDAGIAPVVRITTG